MIAPETHNAIFDDTTITSGHLPKTLICFSHLRWDFVYQRPQHILSRLAKTFNIYFVEEPFYNTSSTRNDVVSKDKIDNVFMPESQRAQHGELV